MNRLYNSDYIAILHKTNSFEDTLQAGSVKLREFLVSEVVVQPGHGSLKHFCLASDIQLISSDNL